MEIDPIQEKTSSINKIKQWFKSLFKKKKPDLEKTLKSLSKNNEKAIKSMHDFTISTDEAGRALAKFGEYLSPNQMREALECKKIDVEDHVTLYSDNKAYCIINRKGDVIWQRNEK